MKNRTYRTDVQIDPAKEDVYPFADLPKLIPGRPAFETIVMWAKRGILHRESRKMVKLESIQLPRGRGSSVEAYHRFLRELNASGT